MSKFNLRFRGEILPGKDPAQVKARFGKLFGIDNPEQVERFFSGENVVLRRNLDRKTAAEYYARLHQIGVEAELVKLATRSPRKTAQPTSARERHRREAEEQERQRRAEEEAARLRAEEKARIQAERDAAKRRAAAEAARRREQELRDRRQAAEEAARRRAEEEENRRQEAAERARIRAERQRHKEEEKARFRAEREEARRKAAEEARHRAAEEARHRAAEEARHRAAEEARRKAAEEAARKREAAKEAARRREEKRQAVAEAARLKAEKEALKRQRAEQAARKKAEEQLRREQKQERIRAEREEQAAQRQAMEAQAIARGAAALGRPVSMNPGRSSVRTALPIPSRRPDEHAAHARRHQPGEPNFYALEPFRNTPEVKGRAARSLHLMSRAFRLAVIAFALLLITAGRYLSFSAPPSVAGPEAMAVDPGSGPLLLAGGHLLSHDRSGTGAEDRTLAALGLEELHPPLAFARANILLATGRLRGGTMDGAAVARTLLRCDLTQQVCDLFSPELGDYRADALAVHAISGAVFVADATAGELLKFDSEGHLVARSAAPVPPSPVIRLDSGLLFMNSAEQPAVAVFRYEDEAFAQPLDKILLQPPAAVHTGQSKLANFIRVGDFWWAYLLNPEIDDGDLFRFDANWNFLEEARLPRGVQARQLAEWNGKLLVADARHREIQRFTASGMSEAPLASELLQHLAQARERSTKLTRLTWHSALVLCSLAAVLALGAGIFLRLRSMVYRTSRERGADPADDLLDQIQWVDPVADRELLLKRRTNLYLLGAVVVLVLVVLFAVDVSVLTALLLALAGPALALALLRQDPVGHIGVAGKELLLVDHRNVYHLGSGSRIQHRGPFLLIDDVVVFTGSRMLPAFSTGQIRSLISTLQSAGVQVDRTTIAIKLLQGRHALATGTLTVLFSSAAALLVLMLPHL